MTNPVILTAKSAGSGDFGVKMTGLLGGLKCGVGDRPCGMAGHEAERMARGGNAGEHCPPEPR